MKQNATAQVCEHPDFRIREMLRLLGFTIIELDSEDRFDAMMYTVIPFTEVDCNRSVVEGVVIARCSNKSGLGSETACMRYIPVPGCQTSLVDLFKGTITWSTLDECVDRIFPVTGEVSEVLRITLKMVPLGEFQAWLFWAKGLEVYPTSKEALEFFQQ